MKPYQSILLATDFSPLSELAAQRAREVAERYHADLHVVHVIEEVVFYGDEVETEANMEDPFFNDKMFELAESRMKDFAEAAGFSDAVKCEVIWGNPKSAITTWAVEHKTDLIVVGTYEHNMIELLLGSVSDSVLHQATCDVLIIRE
jgi:universal stress protein A